MKKPRIPKPKIRSGAKKPKAPKNILGAIKPIKAGAFKPASPGGGRGKRKKDTMV